ncbi:hypothetical protein ASPCAL07679 [Aspergillus calidoustus]|uniref:F-box domain-containing protein n=1 Tax=Aspergillus calidoustus TaxID=454130 RepID=A0A0U5GT91_ASPCI|nr:hypothetical protein ASPCAL07679 [Aspergillus calidoustus]
MRGLLDLPVEILDQVLSLALTEPHSSQLCDFALVNRAWHSRTTVQVYSLWAYNGTRHSFKQLWLFLRTILSNRHLASLVRRVHIGNWGVNPYALLGHEADYSLHEDDISLTRQAIDQAKLIPIESTMISDIRQGDCRPLMALLLASLPNLLVIRAHVPRDDPYLTAVLQRALVQPTHERGTPGPLSQLRDVYVFAEVPVPAEIPLEYLSDIPAAPLRLDVIWPMLFLRSMRKLHLYDLEADGIATLIQKHQDHQTSYINDLLVRTLKESSCQPADLKALIRLPRALLKFSLFVDDQCPHLRKVPSKISNTDIWEALHEHQKEVQYLDIFRAGDQGRNNERPLGHLKSLQGFTRLREIRGQLLHLTGVGTNAVPNEANPLLKDTLPGSLEALRLYCNGNSTRSRSAIAKQIQELVMEGSHPLLGSITLEDEALTKATVGYEDPNGRTDVGRLLLQSRVRFESRGACLEPMTTLPDFWCPVPRAGHCINFWGDMHEVRLDGNGRFFNMTQRISPINEEEDDIPYLPYSRKIHVSPFTTHTGDTTRPGYMVFENYTPIPLPPLLLFVIYFTHPYTVPSATDLQGLYKALTGYEDDVYPRLDVYFLPGATEMDCLAHYAGEQSARGSYKAQIARFQELRSGSSLGLPSPPAPPGQLPGMMLIDDKYPSTKDRGILFICTEKNWRDGQQTLCYVRFHSPELLPGTMATGDASSGNGKSHGTETTAQQNERGHRQPLTVSAIHREQKSINRESPVYEEVEAVDRYIAEVSYEANDVLEWVWKEATYYRWTNWA